MLRYLYLQTEVVALLQLLATVAPCHGLAVEISHATDEIIVIDSRLLQLNMDPLALSQRRQGPRKGNSCPCFDEFENIGQNYSLAEKHNP